MSAVVSYLTKNEIPEALALFGKIIDELHKDLKHREYYKNFYTPERIERTLEGGEDLYLVEKLDGKIIGFLFGWASAGVGNIHWMGVDKDCRRGGLAKKLMRKALKEFKERRCYRAELFTYPRFPAALNFFKSQGFEERASIDKNFLGTSVIFMVKNIKEVSARAMTKRIKLVGEAGQGIKLMAQALANILAKLQKDVSLNVTYGPSVRGGEIEAELVYSDEKIEVPLIDRADVLIQLSRPEKFKKFNAKKVFIEKAVCGRTCVGCDIGCRDSVQLGFQETASQKFGNPLFINMIALGRVLQYIGVNIEKVHFQSELPSQFLQENIEAIKYGYSNRDL